MSTKAGTSGIGLAAHMAEQPDIYRQGWADGYQTAQRDIATARADQQAAWKATVDAQADAASYQTAAELWRKRHERLGSGSLLVASALAVLALIGWAAWWTGCAV